MVDAAVVVSDTAQRLYGQAARKAVNKAFAARELLSAGGIPHPIHPQHPAHPVNATVVATIGQAAPGWGRLR